MIAPVISQRYSPPSGENRRSVIIYGMAGRKLFDMLVNDYGIDPNTISFEKCEDMINQFFNSYPGVAEFIERQGALATNQHYVKNWLGYIRRLPNSYNPGSPPSKGCAPALFAEWREKKAKFEGDKRIATNTVVQSLVAGMMKIAMVRADADIQSGKWDYNGLRPRMLTQVHDELNFECPGPDEHVEAFTHRIEDIIKQVGEDLKITVPMLGDGHWSRESWAAAKG
jgi:DNA polymerase-1